MTPVHHEQVLNVLFLRCVLCEFCALLVEVVKAILASVGLLSIKALVIGLQLVNDVFLKDKSVLGGL